MSHGIKRTRQSKEAIEARKQKEQAKLKEYLALSDDVISRRQENDWTQESFDATTRLLQQNPEFYTVWNYRRNILTNGIFPKCSPTEINEYLSADLEMTTAALKLHPKVYWLWNHRRWCLEHVPERLQQEEENAESLEWRKANWDRELFIVDKMLNADARNFHAWNYRRYVLASMPIPRTRASELAYTTRKIEASFSNFSAWHQRSKVLPLMWAAGELDETRSREEEFDLVKNALYTDPADQSAWLYHRWLVGDGKDASVLQREIGEIQTLLEEQPDSKWCMETLVHYKRLLMALKPEQKELVNECMKLLDELKSIDPMRKHRYEDITTQLSP